MPKQIQATSYTFRDIIESEFLYVDKTRYLYDLVRYGKGTYFLSRPRRFGKSLMISTLEEIFRGSKELFEGLWIYDSDYPWDSYPIIRLDFGLFDVSSAPELVAAFEAKIIEIGQENGLTIDGYDHLSLFVDLVRQLARTHNGKVVLLIDEYDKPIVNNLDAENIEDAIKIRDILRGFYGVIKALDRYWRFVFVTGISRFSRIGIFSTMNNVDDLSLSIRATNLVGFTEDELRTYFKEYIDDFAQERGVTPEELLDDIRRWYDGFRFAHEGERVYNPYSTIQLFLDRRFSNYWFSTGTPSFLIKLMKEQKYDIQSLERVEADDLDLQSYEIENLAIHPLLYQTGYLTITDFEQDELGDLFILSYPNIEVKHSFIKYLLNAYSNGDTRLSDSHLRRLVRSLRSNDLDQFFETLNIFFANIDYQLHLKDEKYYQTIFYMIFQLLGINISAEVKTNKGRIDAVIELKDYIYIFEFKLDKTASTALQQTKNKEYADKYRQHGKTITLVGTNFDFEQRKISEWSSEEAQF